MAFVRISNCITYSNHGVWVDEDALSLSPEELYSAIALAYSIRDSTYTNDAYNSFLYGAKEYQGYTELDYASFMHLARLHRTRCLKEEEARLSTKGRRKEFSRLRPKLLLEMIESGIPTLCAAAECEETERLSIDHKIPLSKGGTNDLQNLQFMCRSHNSMKGTKLE